jgi:anhydro-N-acetylmuramic acid kinase
LKDKQWNYEIVCAETIEYSAIWKEKLLSLETTDALTFQKIHVEYGQYLGRLTSDFIIKNSIKPDFVASHGHTIFHQPDKKLTVQVGAGASISSNCLLPVVCDFRTTDVAFGGQGAPLVPIGDKLLFTEYDFCLNLGGFANISYEHFGKRIAFDVCPVNIVLNALCERIGKTYDDKGNLASQNLFYNKDYNNNHRFTYLRKDLLDKFLLENDYKLIWGIWGERNVRFKDIDYSRKFHTDNKVSDLQIFSDVIEYK